MLILGISCDYHDAAAALIRDGDLVAAAEEERFSRRKHDADFPHQAIQFCLDTAHAQSGDLDYVVFYEKPFRKFERILATTLQAFPRSCTSFRQAMTSWLPDKLWIRATIQEALSIPSDRILFSEHHLSHAASAFFCSPFEEAAILTIDGVGEWATATMGVGKANWSGRDGNEIVIQKELRFPHSVGMLYSVFTAFLGFEVNEGEYKVMGMAPYGQPRYVEDVRRLVQQSRDGSIQLDMDYFSFHRSSQRSFSLKFEDLFGPPRDPNEPLVLNGVGEASGADPALHRRSQRYADIAASIQQVTEELVLTMASSLYEETRVPRLCMAGGVAYNSVANGRILRETPFEEVFIQPAAGDSGGALGAALFAYHVLLQQPRKFVMEHTYWGKECATGDIETAIQRHNLTAQRMADEQLLVQSVAQMLSRGNVIGWCQGRCEWGARALGHRSILADPRRPEMKAIVNQKIKFREPFRPFAPSILDRHVRQFVEHPEEKNLLPLRFMLTVSPVRQECRDTIPAVTHVDGTARPQLVESAHNPLYHGLIEAFAAETGVPVLLNTSFNLKGEPIVNSPDDAISTFLRSEMDALVAGPYLVTKRHRGFA